MATAKVLKKLSAQVQSGSSYEESAPFLMPFTSETLSQNYDPIEDMSNVGVGFRDIPQQGPRHTSGSVEQNIDVISCETIFEAAFGANSSGVFTLGSNSKKLSLCGLNDANAVKYANVYIKTLKISAAAAGLWNMSYEIVGVTAQDRAATGTFPASPTAPGDPFTFHEAGGTGYVRIGDATDALSSSDEINIEDFNLDITCGFDEQYCNEGTGTLTPIFGQVEPVVSGSFTVARHDSDTYLDWVDAHTPLQMTVYAYKSAAATMLIEIPRFIIKVDMSDDSLTKQNVSMMIGRNGTGSSYKNTNMSFTSPVRITIVNS
jgi:hypothetical protein